MYVGAASGAVTVGLALFLVLMSQRPDPTKAEQPQAETPAVQQPDTPPPSVAAVRLPPPPAPRARPPEPAPPRPPLKPRADADPPEIKKITPLQPRPDPVPMPEQTPAKPLIPKPVQSASVPHDKPATPAPAVQAPAARADDAQPVSREAAIEGRALLKMLETGKGPVIEIAWPAASGDRAKLYKLLTACHGMQTAMLADRRKIYAATGTPGSAWQVNRDAVSGFVRRPAGVLTEAERAVIRQIKVRHSMHFGAPVRLFPRAVDATLLGGIGQIVGPGYLKYKTIRARYRLTGNRVTVSDISADGDARPGGIVLPRSRRCG